MSQLNEYVLERFVCQVFNGRARASRALIENAIADGMPVESALCRLIWPTLECAENLRHDGFLNRRTYELALTVLRGLAAETGLRLAHQPSTGTGIMICFAAPAINELPAQIMADIADASGWHVKWQKSATRQSALCDAMRVHHPRAVLVCMPRQADTRSAVRLVDDLRSICPWGRYLLFAYAAHACRHEPAPAGISLIYDPAELALLLNEYVGAGGLCDTITDSCAFRGR